MACERACRAIEAIKSHPGKVELTLHMVEIASCNGRYSDTSASLENERIWSAFGR